MLPDPKTQPHSGSDTPPPPPGFRALQKPTSSVPSTNAGRPAAVGGSSFSSLAAELQANKSTDYSETGACVGVDFHEGDSLINDSKAKRMMERRRAKPEFYDPSPRPAGAGKRGRGRPPGRGRGRGRGRWRVPRPEHARLDQQSFNDIASPVICQHKEQFLGMKNEPQDVAFESLQTFDQNSISCKENVHKTATASLFQKSVPQREHKRQLTHSPSNQPSQVTDMIYEDTGASHPEAEGDGMKVQVGPYNVKASMASILQAIINKHGDFAKDCLFESGYMRNSAVEGICKVIHELERTKLHELDNSKLCGYYSVLRDAQRMKLNVKWLRERLDKLYEAAQVLEHNAELVDEEAQRIELIENMKKNLQLDKAHLEKLKSVIEEQESALALETQLTDKLVNKIRGLMTRYQHLQHSLIDGLL